MAEEGDVGAALTGQTVDPATASGQWDDFLQRPGNRQALLQFGLNLMQPMAFGQTTGGQIGQAIGSAGEAVGRAEDADLKAQLAESKMQQADEKLQILRQNADSNAIRAGAAASRAGAKKVGGLTEMFLARAARDDKKAYEKSLVDDASDLYKEANDFTSDPNSDAVKKYKGKSSLAIREMLRKERPAPGAANEAATTDSTDSTDVPATDAPPVAGARKAKDGNWYAPDPKRPGKFLIVR
jgi:hypothetical protein